MKSLSKKIVNFRTNFHFIKKSITSKKIHFIIYLFFIFFSSIDIYAQYEIDKRKVIEVTGSAEITLEADEIELSIELVEYDLDGKKVTLKAIEKEFYETLKKNHININSLTLNSTDSYYWWYWWCYRDAPYVRKFYKLKLNKETNFLKLVEDLNLKWVRNIQIVSTTNKDVQKYRKEVKMEAIKAAKEKASYLLESVGEKIGGVISLIEIPDNSYGYYYGGSMSSVSNVVIGRGNSISNDDAIQNVANIKLRYEVKAKFEIN